MFKYGFIYFFFPHFCGTSHPTLIMELNTGITLFTPWVKDADIMSLQILSILWKFGKLFDPRVPGYYQYNISLTANFRYLKGFKTLKIKEFLYAVFSCVMDVTFKVKNSKSCHSAYIWVFGDEMLINLSFNYIFRVI